MSCDRNTSQESWSNVDLEDPVLYLHLVLCGSGPGPRAEGAVCGSGSTPQTLELHNSVLKTRGGGGGGGGGGGANKGIELNHPKDFCTEVRGKTKQTCTPPQKKK